MVSLMTPEPKVMTRSDFAKIEEYVDYLETLVEYNKMKDKMETMRKKLAKTILKPVEEVEDIEVLVVEEVQHEEIEEEEAETENNDVNAVDESFEEESDVKDFYFIKGYSKAKNPGKLVIGKQQRFTCQKILNTDAGFKYVYECAVKPENKGNKENQCKARVNVLTDDKDENVEISKVPKLTEHNHACDESKVIKWKIQEDMEEEKLKDSTSLPSDVRKKIILKYQHKYKDQPELWRQVKLLFMPFNLFLLYLSLGNFYTYIFRCSLSFHLTIASIGGCAWSG